MSEPSVRIAASRGRGRTTAQVYQRFAEVDAAGSSPLYARVAAALGASDQARRAIETAPARGRHPALILAALHDLVLAGRAPALAAAYAAGDADGAAREVIDTLVRLTDAVVATVGRRRMQTIETVRGAILRPALAEAARRVGADEVGLVDVACGAGFNLVVDRVGISYADGPLLGDPSSPVQLLCAIKGRRPLPTRAMPEVVTRIGIDLDPIDVTDEDDARWLRACLWPDQPDHAVQRERLDAAMGLVANDAPLLLRGDAVDLLPDALARVPAGVLPIVTSTWALSSFPPERRLRFLQHLDAAATDRAVAWVSVEGVGVAPGVPTLGDRHASGHSIVGLTIFEHATTHAEAVGRCWSRGRWLAWLADT